MMSGPQSFGFVSGQKDFTTNKTGGAFKTPPVVSPAFYGQANLVPLRHDNLGYCFKKCVSNKRKKSTDFLDLQEIKTTKTKKV